jgi:hypothetical protein
MSRERSTEETTHECRSRYSGDEVGCPLDELGIEANLLCDRFHLRE